MGYLLNAEWRNGMGMEDLSTWGTDPLYQFLEMFDEYFVQGAGPNEMDEPFGVFIYFQMKNILLDMDKVIYRFLDDATGRKSLKKKNIEMIMNANDEQSEAIYKKVLEMLDAKTA